MKRLLPLIGIAVTLTLTACDERSNMKQDAHLKPYEPSAFFPDRQSARPLVEGVVARDEPDDDVLTTGMANGRPVQQNPLPVTMELLQRGRVCYDIACTPCHGLAGYGDGMIALRGFPTPPSIHVDRLPPAPDGYWFDVITHGLGKMPPSNIQVTPNDRWAIVAYVRALQISQHASAADVPPDQRHVLEGGGRE